jgi:cation diffusion facilitator CzcD-associated flavoprotein CzcO
VATISTSGPTHGRRDLVGIVDFGGRVVEAGGLVVADVEVGQRVACIGADQPTIDAVASLVAAGHQVKVFEDRPRLVLPDIGLWPLDRASLCATLAGSTRRVLRSVGSVPAPGAIRRRFRGLPPMLEHRAGSLHRQRLLEDRWDRRQLTPSRFDRRPALRGADYYRAIDSGACRLISWPVAGITASGIRTCDGLEHRADWIVVAP